MQNAVIESKLADLLARYSEIGGVLDYVFFELTEDESAQTIHRKAALAGIAEIDRGYEQWALSQTSEKYPLEHFFRVWWDETNLTGEPVSFLKFWGNDDVAPKKICSNAWSIPPVDGYKTAFYYPPYRLQATEEEKNHLFEHINGYVFGSKPKDVEIISWSTNWSNYFNDGLEYWGAFYWTIRSAKSKQIVVIGASATD